MNGQLVADGCYLSVERLASPPVGRAHLLVTAQSFHRLPMHSGGRVPVNYGPILAEFSDRYRECIAPFSARYNRISILDLMKTMQRSTPQ